MTVDANRIPHTTWHSIAAADVLAKFESDSQRGLSEVEAKARLDTYGPNRLRTPPRWVRVHRLADQFSSPLVWLLLVAATVSGVLLGAWIDAVAITVIVVVNAVLGYIQETRADSALELLEGLTAPTATVIRGGRFVDMPAIEVVPGDLLAVDSGDLVPADARLIETIRLEMSEASLTGESLPVTKTTAPVDARSGLGDRLSMLHAGTTAVRGRGRAVVTATGSSTEMGAIAASISDPPPQSPLQIEMARIGQRLAVIALVAAGLIFGTGLAQDYPIETMALTAVALAVAAIPEGLPAIVTVTLAGGMQRMARRSAVVRRLPAVETLGAVDVICTDKTGTLTKGELAVAWFVFDGHRVLPPDLDVTDPVASDLVETAVLCNDARHDGGGHIGDPLETALMKAFDNADVDSSSISSQLPRIDERAFDSRRKRMSTLNRKDGAFVLNVKGAPEVVLQRSSRVATGEGVVPIDSDLRAALAGEAEDLAKAGFRTLAVAYRTLSELPEDPADSEADLVYVGLIGFSDEIREEVPGAVAKAADAGVRTVVVTGDHLTTAKSVSESIGLGHARHMHGTELHEVTEDSLAEVIDRYDLFARVDPVDKVKIVKAWEKKGAIVAMTGDGVNDAPALNAADIGVAMGSGTDISRDAASLVLTDDNYATIVDAIAEGRRIFHNLRNVVYYLLSANTSEVLYMVFGFAFFGSLGEPMLAVQLLWINLLSDALPAVALGIDVPERDLMKDPPGVGRDILKGRSLLALLEQGAVLAAAAMAVLLIGHFTLDLDYAAVRTMVFTTLVLSQLFHVVNVRTEGRSPLTMPRPFLSISIGISALLQIGVVYSSIGNTVFRTVPLGVSALAWVLVMSALSFVAVRVLKKRQGL